MTIGPIVEKRLLHAASLSKFYTWMNRPVNATSLSKNRLSNHGDYMKLLEELKGKDKPDLEKVGQKYSIIKLMEDFPLYLQTQIGVRGVPLSYIIREHDAPAPVEPLATDKPYSAENGSFHKELVAHMPHEGIGFNKDNAEVFTLLLSVFHRLHTFH